MKYLTKLLKQKQSHRSIAFSLIGVWAVLSVFLTICWNFFLPISNVSPEIETTFISTVESKFYPDHKWNDCHIETKSQFYVHQWRRPISKIGSLFRLRTEFYFHSNIFAFISKRASKYQPASDSLFERKILLLI